MARKMNAGTAIGADVNASRLATSPMLVGGSPRVSSSPVSLDSRLGRERRTMYMQNPAFIISPTARMDCEDAASLSTPWPYLRSSV